MSASNVAVLGYDPMGRLWQVTSASGTRQLVYDGDALVGEYDGSGNPLARYVDAIGEDKPGLCQSNVAGGAGGW